MAADFLGTIAVAPSWSGMSARLLEMTADRVKSRQAFGAPLAALQGVQLRAADMYLDFMAARGAVSEAAALLVSGADGSARWSRGSPPPRSPRPRRRWPSPPGRTSCAAAGGCSKRPACTTTRGRSRRRRASSDPPRVPRGHRPIPEGLTPRFPRKSLSYIQSRYRGDLVSDRRSCGCTMFLQPLLRTDRERGGVMSAVPAEDLILDQRR